MQLNAFRYFAVLAETGSFYGAAKKLLISQQGLSKSITMLESELGVKLVERRRSGIRLTREGEVTLRHAQSLLAEYDLMMDDLFSLKTYSLSRTERVMVHVSYYSAQIASFNPEYINMLSQNLLYIEEPFDKLLKRAETSDGSDLVFLDIHAHSMRDIAANPLVVFKPVLSTRLGFVWKDDSDFSHEALLHREAVSLHPVAINTNKEMAQLTDRLFADMPLSDIRMGSTNPRMLLEYTLQADDVPCLSDSFGFYLAKTFNSPSTEKLHFTPLSTPQAQIMVGFLYPRGVKMTPGAEQVTKTLDRFLKKHCADYLQTNPVEGNH